jgi:hypothetical protein
MVKRRRIISLLCINRYLGVTATCRRQEENPHKAGSWGDAREAGRSAFQKGHKLDLSEIGSEARGRHRRTSTRHGLRVVGGD